jgi:hypothetical protein
MRRRLAHFWHSRRAMRTPRPRPAPARRRGRLRRWRGTCWSPRAGPSRPPSHGSSLATAFWKTASRRVLLLLVSRATTCGSPTSTPVLRSKSGTRSFRVLLADCRIPANGITKVGAIDRLLIAQHERAQLNDWPASAAAFGRISTVRAARSARLLCFPRRRAPRDRFGDFPLVTHELDRSDRRDECSVAIAIARRARPRREKRSSRCPARRDRVP